VRNELLDVHRTQLAELNSKYAAFSAAQEARDANNSKIAAASANRFNDELTQMAFSIKGDLTREFSTIAADFYGFEAAEQEKKESWVGAFSANLKRMEYLMKGGSNKSAGGVLKNIYKALKSMSPTSRGFIPPWHRDKLRLLISELPSEFEADGTKVIELFQVIQD
jgi:hypothetical protein